MTSSDLKNHAVSVMALAVAVAVIAVGIEGWRLGRDSRRALNQIAPEILQASKQVKVASFELQAAAKAARDEWEDPRYQRARFAALRLGEQGQVTLARINQDLLPQLIGTARSANLLIANTDVSLNRELLPQLTRTSRNLADLAAAFQADERQIAAELVNSIQAGQASVEQVNRLLASDAIPSILANLDKSSGELAQTSANITAMTAQWPEMALEINRIIKTGRRWQKPVMIAGLLANIARILF